MMELNKQKNNSNKFDFILNSISLSLGNQTTVKCLADGIKFTKCWAKILDELVHSSGNHEDPFINLLNKYFQSYHNSNICSSKTGLVLTILLWKVFNQKLFLNQNQSQRYDQVFHEIDKIFNSSIENLKNDARLVKRIQSKLFEVKKSGRYWINFVSKQNEDYLKNLINGLCRSQLNNSDLIWNIFKYNNFKIDLNHITFSIDDSQLEDFSDENWFFINSGILFKIDDQNLKIKDYDSLNSIIIDANLTHNYTHLGYNKDIKYNKIVKSIDFTSYSNQVLNTKIEWLNKIKKFLIENKLKLLIVSGCVDPDVLNFCSKENIIVLMSLNAEKFKVIKNYFNFVTCIVYIEDFSPCCLFQCKLENSNYKNYLCIKKTDDNEEDKNEVISVLIKKNRHMFLLKNQIKMFIEELKHNLKRFENVLSDKLFVENYNACLESNFARIIDDAHCNSDDDTELNFSLAKEILYETFINYKNIIGSNVDINDDCILIYDDLKSKIESWQFALDMNRIFLNIDLSLFCS